MEKVPQWGQNLKVIFTDGLLCHSPLQNKLQVQLQAIGELEQCSEKDRYENRQLQGHLMMILER